MLEKVSKQKSCFSLGQRGNRSKQIHCNRTFMLSFEVTTKHWTCPVIFPEAHPTVLLPLQPDGSWPDHTSLPWIVWACTMSGCEMPYEECRSNSLHRVFGRWWWSLISSMHLHDTNYDIQVIQSIIVVNSESQIQDQRYWIEIWGFHQYFSEMVINSQSTCSTSNPSNSQNTIND